MIVVTNCKHIVTIVRFSFSCHVTPIKITFTTNVSLYTYSNYHSSSRLSSRVRNVMSLCNTDMQRNIFELTFNYAYFKPYPFTPITNDSFCPYVLYFGSKINEYSTTNTATDFLRCFTAALMTSVIG